MTLSMPGREGTATLEGSLTLSEVKESKTLTPREKDTKDEEEGQQLREEPRGGSGGDQVLRTTSLSSSSTRVAGGTSTDPNRDWLDRENDRVLLDQSQTPANPWNAFQKANRGRGWSQIARD